MANAAETVFAVLNEQVDAFVLKVPVTVVEPVTFKSALVAPSHVVKDPAVMVRLATVRANGVTVANFKAQEALLIVKL